MSTPHAAGPLGHELSDAEVAVLDFERVWAETSARRSAGAKEVAIRSQLGLTATRYYQLLHAVIENPVALTLDPLLVRRLQRIRATRSRARAARTFRTD